MIDVNKYVKTENSDLTEEEITDLKDKFMGSEEPKVNLEEVIPDRQIPFDERIKRIFDIVHEDFKSVEILESANDPKMIAVLKDPALEERLELAIILKGEILNGNFLVETILLDKMLNLPDWTKTQLEVNDILFKIG